MSEQSQQLHRLELIISKVLRIGVLTAGVCLFWGWIGMWMQDSDVLMHFQTYHPEPLLERIQWGLLMQDRPLLISLLGLILLVCLPLLRVLLTGILFLKQKDYRLAVMAFLVFGTLIGSFLLGVEL